MNLYKTRHYVKPSFFVSFVSVCVSGGREGESASLQMWSFSTSLGQVTSLRVWRGKGGTLCKQHTPCGDGILVHGWKTTLYHNLTTLHPSPSQDLNNSKPVSQGIHNHWSNRTPVWRTYNTTNWGTDRHLGSQTGQGQARNRSQWMSSALRACL